MRDVFLSHVPVTLVVRMSPSVTCTPSSMVVTHKSFSPGSLLGPIWGVSGGEEEGGALVGLPHLRIVCVEVLQQCWSLAKQLHINFALMSLKTAATITSYLTRDSNKYPISWVKHLMV